ncbi:zeta toxin family protein [Bacteroides faecium]|uniref:AAA family ATPase n=1 Tax=Bacteroides faecium TaxID=2715212 RepID=A0A6H0KQL5_9BACE|nr:zeta toxin family protein [Bacteroides faecium]QIU95321.1 AAA family ATPase [Bacteroides faecium]
MNHSMHNPVLIVIAGPNGSGKTSVTSKILHHEWMEDAVYINPDIIAQEKYGNWNSKDAVMQAVRYCEELREQCLVEHKSLIFETVLSVEDKIDYILRAKEAGFFIRFFFVCTEHPTINAARIARRVMEGGHDVPITKIISRYDKSIANSSIVSEFVDRAYIYDNSIEDVDAQLLFRLKEGRLVKQYVDVIPRWALAIYDKRDD